MRLKSILKNKILATLVFLVLIFLNQDLNAQVRVSGGLGLGSSGSKNEISQSEGPLIQSYGIEFVTHSKLTFGAEHIRSVNLSPLSSAISFTGLFFRYYLNASTTPFASVDDIKATEIIIHDFSYFLGSGFGVGQSNMLANAENLSSNAAGLYLSPRAGMEFGLTRKFGVRGELLLASSVFGKGTLSSIGMVGYVFYSF
jgi:hypothetical protein